IRAQDLKRDVAIVLEIARQIDGGHSAGADFALDGVTIGKGGAKPVGNRHGRRQGRTWKIMRPVLSHDGRNGRPERAWPEASVLYRDGLRSRRVPETPLALFGAATASSLRSRHIQRNVLVLVAAAAIISSVTCLNCPVRLPRRSMSSASRN